MAIGASDVIVFKSIRFRVSTLIRYVCVFICIHFQQRFQIDAFSVNTLSVFERISVDGRPKRIEMYAFSNENALVWTGPKLSTTTALSYWFPLFISQIVDFNFDIKIALYTVTLLTGAYIGIAFAFTRKNYTLLKKKYSPAKHKSVSRIAQV